MDPVIPTPVANGSLSDAQNFVNTLPGNMTPEQRGAIASANPDWHPNGTPAAVPVPQGATVGDLTKDASSAAPAESPAPLGHGLVAVPQGATVGDLTKPEQSATPRSFDDPRVAQLGYYVNGDGNTVIAPKDGESYEDTIRRAITHSKQMSPEERHAALARETGNAGEKVATTLGAAPAIGLGGAALLALTAETPEALKQIATKAPQAYQAARAFVYRQLAAGTPTLFGEEAAKATLKRMAVKAATKLATGGAIGAGASLFHSVFEEMFGGK